MTKPKFLIVASVPHSATRFTCNLFKEVGYEIVTSMKDVSDKPTVLQIHFQSTNYFDICKYAEQDLIIIVPIRRPINVIKSWKKRYNTSGDILTQLAISYYFIQKYKPFVLQIDEPGREDRLAYINFVTGLNLKTDWQRTGESYSADRSLNDVETYTETVLDLIYKGLI